MPGIRNTVMSADAFAGPLMLAVVRAWLSPQVVFVATGVGLLAPAVVALVALPRAATPGALDGRRHVAGAAVVGVVMMANAARINHLDRAEHHGSA